MKETNKTFEFHYEIEDLTYTVKGVVSSFACEEDIDIENVDMENYRDLIFNISLICNPKVDLKIFDHTKALVYILGLNGKEGQLGYIENNIFVQENEENDIVRQICASILEILSINGSGHFIDQ
ncbi:hypothetical protein J2799_001743 [Chryseobacterium vietnamense]|uniref:hypothetical protein n=1 Tax=Chryseobacterium vietnamense TaxID=866785 RepID=UPI002855223B|nr:hypothetical protein [Chryseobacterium vietnamense]MDR6487258.1 hypothetical protein [Chryseobacterium vietnamense]